MEALAPKVTIAGQEVSTATEFLELVDGTFTDADVETLKQLGSLKRIYLDGVTIETEDLSWVAQFPKLTEFSCEGYLMDELDLTPFAGLTELTRLSFYQNGNSVGMGVNDLSPLAGLTQMKRLDLSVGFEVTDLDALAGMTQLESLRLWGNSNNLSNRPEYVWGVCIGGFVLPSEPDSAAKPAPERKLQRGRPGDKGPVRPVWPDQAHQSPAQRSHCQPGRPGKPD